jgi:hypothetical protein
MEHLTAYTNNDGTTETVIVTGAIVISGPGTVAFRH